jgi:dienelactone hydrolase
MWNIKRYVKPIQVALVLAACANLGQPGQAAESELAFPSADPASYEQILAQAPLPTVQLSGRLYLPAWAGSHPVVIITPGSGGVSPAHIRHAQALAGEGIGVFLIDPFTGRGIKNTITDQSKLSFAASTYDVLAAAKKLAAQANIDSTRIGAMGYSRGGIAVLQAAVSPLAQAVLGTGKLKAVLVGWPWCGFQFAAPATAPTSIRFLVAESDDWVSPVQCQGYAAAMASTNADVSIRLFKGAFHGFGYGAPIREIPNAVKAFNAPIIYIDRKGAVIDWYSGEPKPGIGEWRYLQANGKPFFGTGVHAGSAEGQAEAFLADVIAFFKRAL